MILLMLIILQGYHHSPSFACTTDIWNIFMVALLDAISSNWYNKVYVMGYMTKQVSHP